MVRRLGHFFQSMFRRRRLEDDLDEELLSSFETMVEQFVARGMSLAEARRAARLEFEGLEQVKEHVRDTLVGSGLRTFFQDIHYSWRGLCRRRSFAAIALVTLSLGIGVNTAVFSIFYAVLMRPLPYRQPEDLVLIWSYVNSRGKGAISGQILRDSRAVTVGYLQTMGVRLVEGRYFDSRDHSGAPYVVIVDETLAQSTWPGESAIGKTIEAEHMTPNGSPFELVPSTVIGVVEHVQTHSLTRKIRGQIYSPFEQNTRDGFPQTFVLRTRVPPVSLVPTIRALLPRNPPVAMDKVRPMTEYIEREIAPAGFTAVLGAIFGGLALVLAATGIYGVLNYQVSRRLPEMGIRMAVGATTRDVLALILRESAMLAAGGVLLGVVAAYFAARGLGALLYQVSASDPWSYFFALLLLPAAALLGCWRPAWRAAAANPAEIIKEE